MSGGNNIGGAATFSVMVTGSAVPDEMRVLSVHIEKKVNRIAIARITILDGKANTGKFHASSSATFIPGNSISIEAGYDSVNQVVFQGIITSQALTIDNVVGSTLEVECRDQAVDMIVGRKSLTWSGQTDSAIISAIIGNYSGLTANVDSTSTTWPEQIQYYVTDWDFILALADANGLIVTTINGTVSVVKPDDDTTSVLTVAYGKGLLEFSAKLDSGLQLGNVTSSAWDYKGQAVATGQASSSLSGSGNLSTDTLSETIGLGTYQLQTTAPLETADLNNWANAQIVKSEYSKIIGEAKFQGTTLVNPGKYITFAGLGDRFNGDYLISGVTHDLSKGNWTTEVSLGLSPLWFTEAPDVMSPSASGLIPGARGLFNATVKQLSGDPDSQYRILVTVPLFDPNGAGIWARLTNFYSTSGAGAFFLPEVGDEVILGFLNEDPRYPVILGSVYSSSQIQPYNTLNPTDGNPLKAIVSKTGILLQFDDQNKVFTIATPANNTIIISDTDQKITIQDQNQNSIVMSATGIAMNSNQNITINSKQQVSITGDLGVSIAASGGDVQISGLNIQESADVQYTASGGEMLQLTGAMIMIN